MATKLTRQTLYQFGSTVNGASEVGVYGSGATGSPAYTASITLMQSLAAWGRGWAAETIANNRPFLEDMNAVDCVFGYQLSYILQQGIPEFDTTSNSNYFLNSVVQYSGVIYQVINDNAGNGISATLPTNTTYWRQVFPLTTIFGAWVSKSVNTVYHATTDGIVIGYGDTGATVNALTEFNVTPPTISRFPGEVSGPAGTVVLGAISPVTKGDYYEITSTGSGTVFFIPIGS